MNTKVAEYLQLLKRRVVTATDAAAKAEAQVDLALFQLRAGEVDLTAAMLQEVYAMGELLGEPERSQVLAIATYGKGVVSVEKGRLSEAVSLFLHAANASRIARAPRFHARSLAYLAQTCARLGAHRDSIEFAVAGLNAESSAKDLRTVIAAHGAFVLIYYDREQFDLALHHVREATVAAAALGDPFQVCAMKCASAATTSGLASLLMAKAANDATSKNAFEQALSRAREECEESLAYSREVSNSFVELAAMGNLSEVAFMKGDADEAIALIHRAYAMSVKLDSLANAANSLMLWGGYELMIGRVGDALGHLEEGLDYAKQSGSAEFEVKILRKLSECYEKQGRLHDALDAQRSYALSLQSQRLSELTNLVALTEAKRESLWVRGRVGRINDDDPDDDSP